MFQITDNNLTMEDLLVDSDEYLKPELGSVIEGAVLSVKKNQLVVDINGITVGIVAGRETHDSLGTIKDLKEGDNVKAVVIEKENEDGMVVLSLRKASQATAWDRFEEAYKNSDIIEITVNEANKGGLLVDTDGIKGFIPVSQLAPIHYPRVEGADSGQILTRLQKLIGQKLNVRVINVDRATGKMILSERAAAERSSKQALSKIKIGDRATGKVSGVVKFGIFVTFDGLEGLVHISEIAWGHVSDPHQHARVGDKVEVEIIGVEGDKLSLSIKRLVPDPWQIITEKYPIGSTVKGIVNRFSQFGAFIQLEGDLNGLIHLSEISNQKVEDPQEFLSIGEEIEAQVINIDREEHRIGLSVKALQKKAKKKAKKSDEEEVKEEVVEKKVEDTLKEEKEDSSIDSEVPKKAKKEAAKTTTSKKEEETEKKEVSSTNSEVPKKEKKATKKTTSTKAKKETKKKESKK